MKAIHPLIAAGLFATLVADEDNARIDYPAFRDLTAEVEAYRRDRRVDEAEFLRLASEEGTVILDTRSREKFDLRHVKGAVHLNFSDFTSKSLAEVIPDKSTRILIYCNNNFIGDPASMAMKLAPLALNIPTFIHLYGYGYRNVYELQPDLPLSGTRIPFEGRFVLPRPVGEDGMAR
ncbi:rhodanese-like domain-containing protein [Haloferula sargassicola]|uniref:Rhodanese domain-containing protein n=1 Tax=Haloferula sargassicola TaxID=490096 RepID=A0ABP9UTF3_9BACT